VTALSYACRKGHSEIVEALLNANADPNVEKFRYVSCWQLLWLV